MGGFVAVMFEKKRFPAAIRYGGVLVVLVHLVSGGAYASHGLLSPSGIGIYVAPVMYYLWIAAVSLVLWRERPAGNP